MTRREWLRPAILLLLSMACLLATAGPSPRFLKLGALDVHDELTVEERLRVMWIMQQLQRASLTRSGRKRNCDGSIMSGALQRLKYTSHVNKTFFLGHVKACLMMLDGDNHRLRFTVGLGPWSSMHAGAESDEMAPQDETSDEERSVSRQQSVSQSPVQPGHHSSSTPTRSPSPPAHGTATPTQSVQIASGSFWQHSESLVSRRFPHEHQSVNEDREGSPQIQQATTRHDMDVKQQTRSNNRSNVASFPELSWTDGVAGDVVVETQAGLLFEGDIMLSPEEAEQVLHRSRRLRKRKVAYSKDKRWTLPIPYMFDQTPQYKLNESEMARVRAVMTHLEELTCITLREVNATHGTCWSYVGKERAFHFQEVSTGEGCFEFGTLLHELGHAIGFWHEHSRPDRNAFIRVHKEHVRPGEEYNFDEESWGKLDNMDVPYDVSSIMHYGSTYFSKNGQVTIQALDTRLQRVVGQRLEMSFYDVKLANKAYCSDVCKKSPVEGTCLHEGYPDPKNCNRCRCPPGLAGTQCQQVAPYQGPVACGGPLYVEQGQRYSISSPSHSLNVYPANVACNWLIQTQVGFQVKLTVNQQDFMTHPDCTSEPTDICVDYLEVKYNVSFGYTGARYCCGLPPAVPLRSGSNAMLVLFRTRQAGSGGFRADIEAEPCGGCHPGAAHQPPCRKNVRSQCVKKWNTTEYVSCSTFFRGTGADCDKTKTESRLGICNDEVDFCCDGFQVIAGLCKASNGSKPASKTKPPTAGTSQQNASSDIGQDADSGWSAWLPWQPCSRSCGGCGVQTRTRVCDNPLRCGGRSSEQESRACNTFPCPELLVYMCAKTRVKDYYCGWGTKCY
ncbi:hypothetical protein BaRGS_00023116, partial [Batillaria attramentaria]